MIKNAIRTTLNEEVSQKQKMQNYPEPKHDRTTFENQFKLWFFPISYPTLSPNYERRYPNSDSQYKDLMRY